jgi:GTP-binding protein LepA
LKLSTKDPKKLADIKMHRFDDQNLLLVRTASEYPEEQLIEKSFEPWVKLEIITPTTYMASIIDLVKKHRGIYKNSEYITSKFKDSTFEYVILSFEIPTAEIITNFFDKLKSISQGYASMDYDQIDYREADVVKVSILVNYENVESLAFITHRAFAQKRGKNVVETLSNVIPRQQFQVPVQAAISGKIIARADIRAYRKDVIEKLYGGDVTRKKKLLEKQKKGKKRLKAYGKVEIPKEAFLAVLKSD